MTAGPLASLLLDEDAADRPFALSGGCLIGLHRFRRDVAALSARVVAARCRRGLVVCEDAYWATVGFFALAHAGAEMLLPPNLLPATLAALNGSYDHILTTEDTTVAGPRLDMSPGDGQGLALPAIDAEQARVTLFTSGSTGTPKRIVKTVRQLEVEAETVDRVLGEHVPGGAAVHATVPYQHLYGLTFRVCWPLATHRPIHGVTHQFWEPLLTTMKPADVLVTSPSHLSRLDAMAPLPPERQPSAILSGGAPLPDEAARAARAVLGCPVREFFGSTEAGVIASRLRTGDGQPSWHAMPGVTVTRLDDNRLHVRSAYLVDPEGEESEDLIELDADGGFHLKGRADRVTKIEGIRVSLTEFETQLRTLNGVREGSLVVLGDKTPYLGGVVVLDAAGADELAAIGTFRLGRRLRRDLSRNLPQPALPRRWRFVAEMPLGPLGKVRTSDLAALFAED